MSTLEQIEKILHEQYVHCLGNSKDNPTVRDLSIKAAAKRVADGESVSMKKEGDWVVISFSQ